MTTVPEVMNNASGMMYVVLVCGDREYTRVQPIKQEIAGLYEQYGHRLKIVHGGCARKANGKWVDADMIADTIARLLGIPVSPYPADWNRHGNSAGPIRNSLMLANEQPDLVLAFHSNINSSKGTKDMVTKARGAGVPVKVIK